VITQCRVSRAEGAFSADRAVVRGTPGGSSAARSGRRRAVPARRGGMGGIRLPAGGGASPQHGRGAAGDPVLPGEPGGVGASRSGNGTVRRRQRDRVVRGAVDGGDELGPGDRLRGAARRGAARCGQRRPAQGLRRTRPLVPTRPGERAMVDPRWERGHERGRPVLREVRRHGRLRARAGSRDRSRRDRPARTAHRQGSGGLRPVLPDGRLGGNPRRDHRDHRPAASRKGARADRGRVLRLRRRRRASGERRRGGWCRAVGLGAGRPPLPGGRGRVEADGAVGGGRRRPARTD
jgi:hypothetical protein